MTWISEFMALVRRWPYCALCVLIAVLGVVGAWFLHQELRRLQVAHADRAKEGEAMLGLLVAGSTVKQELDVARDATRRLEDNLVVETNLADNLWYFYKLEEQTQARLPQLHQMSSPTTDKSPLYRRVPYSLRITGRYEQVAGFVQALETGPRLVNITGFNYARTDASGATIALDLNVELLGKR